jgi:Zn-dependent protease
MTDDRGDPGDPLDRLAAEEDWSRRAREVEDEVAKQRRRKRLRSGPRLPRPSRATGHTHVPRGRISWIFYTLVAITVVTGVLLWTGLTWPPLTVFVFVIAGWLVSLSLHEYLHALTAHRRGDYTVEDKGYLRLDLRTYGHPVLTFVFPLLFLIMGGLPLPGGAVMIEHGRLRGRFGSAMVSAAGPAVNIVAAIILLAVVSVLGPQTVFLDVRGEFWAALTFLAFLQVATAILNLIPIPGVDGYGVLEPFLPHNWQRTGDRMKPYGLILLFLFMLLPPVRSVFSTVCGFFMDVSGAPLGGQFYGQFLFQFWKHF